VGEEEEEEEEEHEQDPNLKSRVSVAWTYFNKSELVYPTDPKTGKMGKPFYYARCKLCQSEGKKVTEYKTEKGGGTGTLLRHLYRVHGISSTTGKVQQTQTQTQISGFASTEPGTGMPFRYSQDRMIDEMSDFVIAKELPFTFGQSKAYTRMNRRALNPSYKECVNNTVKRRSFKRFYKAQKELIKELDEFKGRVCLTSDCWSAPHTSDSFMCVTLHWIDTKWVLQKRIIAFELFNVRHTGQNICALLKETMEEYKIDNKKNSISFDKATANAKAIEFAIADWPHLLLNGRLLHVRCCAHIINLSAQDGLEYLNPILVPIKSCIDWIRHHGAGKRMYKRLCQENNFPYVDWSGDTPTRWDSTYYMLKKAIRYKRVIVALYSSRDSNVPLDNQFNEWMWTVAGHCCNLLKSYKDATKVFSYVYDPNVHFVIMKCVQIMDKLVETEKELTSLNTMLVAMKDKWRKYFTKFPYIYGMAVILDPTAKKIGLEELLKYYYKLLGINFNVSEYVDECVNILKELCIIYSRESGTSESTSTSTKKSKFTAEWKKMLFKSSSSSSSSNASSATTDLDAYLKYDIHEPDDSFSILTWWCTRAPQYPLLSRIARDCLVVPASTVASESAFSAGRRIMTDYRASMGAQTLKMAVMKKDWDNAKWRNQGESSPEHALEEAMILIDKEDLTLTESDASRGSERTETDLE